MSDAPSTLKERLRSDLTAAIRDRDKIRSGTIRMVLTAITEAEVAGSEAVELSDQQVLDVVIRKKRSAVRRSLRTPMPVAPNWLRKSVRSLTCWVTTCRSS